MDIFIQNHWICVHNFSYIIIFHLHKFTVDICEKYILKSSEAIFISAYLLSLWPTYKFVFYHNVVYRFYHCRINHIKTTWNWPIFGKYRNAMNMCFFHIRCDLPPLYSRRSTFSVSWLTILWKVPTTQYMPIIKFDIR